MGQKRIAIAACIVLSAPIIAQRIHAQPGGSAAAPKSEDGWAISMMDSHAGKFKISMTKTRAAVNSGFLTYLIGPPDYSKMLIVSNETKTYTRKNIQQWILDNYGQRNKIEKTETLGEKTIAGIKCKAVRCTGKQQILWTKRITWKPCTTDICATDAFKLSKGLESALNILSGAPSCNGFPMYVDTVTPLGHTHFQKAITASKAKLQSTTFNVPPNYKEVNNELEIMFGSKLNKEHLDELMLSK